MDRLARNLDDLRSLVRRLTDRGVRVYFLKENLVFDGTSNSMSQLLPSVIGAFAEFERNLILERQREGIAFVQGRMRVNPVALRYDVGRSQAFNCRDFSKQGKWEAIGSKQWRTF